MRKYHHLGIPTTENKEGEAHVKHLKVFVSGYKESPYQIDQARHQSNLERVKDVGRLA